MKLVIIESPYAGEILRNTEYARRCVRHSLSLGEAPIASHLLYTQSGILDDDILGERMKGISAGLAWFAVAEAVVVYCDHGQSAGMLTAINIAKAADIPVIYRQIL